MSTEQYPAELDGKFVNYAIYVSNWHLSFNLWRSRHCLRVVIVVPEISRDLYPFLLFYERVHVVKNHNSFLMEIESIEMVVNHTDN